jgi:hypothetical protein
VVLVVVVLGEMTVAAEGVEASVAEDAEDAEASETVVGEAVEDSGIVVEGAEGMCDQEVSLILKGRKRPSDWLTIIFLHVSLALVLSYDYLKSTCGYSISFPCEGAMNRQINDNRIHMGYNLWVIWSRIRSLHGNSSLLYGFPDGILSRLDCPRFLQPVE